MLSIKRIGYASLITLCAGSLFAQTVDEIMSRHTKALGGIDKISAVKTLKVSGTVQRGGGRRTANLDFTRYIKMPNKVRNEVEVRRFVIMQGFDGTQGWSSRPDRDGGVRRHVIKGAALQAVVQSAHLVAPLLKMQENGMVFTFEGEEKLDGANVYKLKGMRKNGGWIFAFLDSESLMEVKREMVRTNADGKEIKTKALFGDYKPVGGVMIAHKITGTNNNPMGQRMRNRRGGNRRGGNRQGGRSASQTGVTTIEKIEINTEMDDALFAMPKD